MEKSWPIAVFAIVLITIVCVSGYTDQGNHEKQGCAGNCAPVSAISAGEPHQTSQNGNTPKSTPFWRKAVAWPEGVACMAVLATLFFIAWQALLTRQAIASSDAATRTELRAYVGVLISNANYQERDKNLKFAGIPALTNTGKTPAHKVRYRNGSAVLMEPISKDYVFPAGPNEIGEYVLGMNTPMIMHTDVADYFDPTDADDILHGRGSRVLYSWGTVFYEDVFGDSHQTDFCHRIFFFPDLEKVGKWKVGGHYIAGRNTAT
jgi:hypothetical protein